MPAAGFTGDAAVLDDMVGSAAFGARGSALGREETRRTLQRSPTGVTSFGGTVGGNSMISSPTSKKPNDRDFAWLLRVLFDFAEEDAREIAGRPSFLEDLVRGGGRPASSNKNAAHLGPFGVGVKIPETVILEKGKPKRRYSVDPRGTPEVTKMKTSAELLRVLREFVRKAAHHMGRKALRKSRIRSARNTVGKSAGPSWSKLVRGAFATNLVQVGPVHPAALYPVHS